MLSASTSALIYRTRHHIANGFRLIQSQSSFKWLFIIGFALFFEIGLWVLFMQSYKFLDSFGGAGMLIIGRLFSLFFTGMGVMLLMSGSVIAYSTIFSSDEIPFLITKPFSISQIVIYKFIESAGFSSWAFFFVIIPFTGTYAWHQHLSPLFALWTLLFSLPFLFFVCGMGTLFVLLLVRWFPRKRIVRQIGLPLLLVATAVGWYYTGKTIKPLMQQQFNISQLIPGLKLASCPLNPGWWISEGIIALSQGAWQRGLLFFGVLSSSALMTIMLVEWLARHTFYDAWQLTLTSGRHQRRPRGSSQAGPRLAHRS